ncbi:transposase [Evansella tamaricis]|uniref:Transposase n=1 Tax=Evansella tamaricis TaxID=2069301 RepID=A0ABS6JGR9_9BACI|nr:transposase [Evansella tamaricis]MBU9712796.1 transposase [Evansella tamaricis]
MPIPKRQWYPGAIYHVISRGIRRSPIFLCPGDFIKFNRVLDNTLQYTPYHLHAYCLMTNHYHLLVGTKSDPLHKIMHSINGSYATWFNKKYKLSGHVFENRYSSHPVPSDYGLMAVSAYIHNNPLAANMIDDPIYYPWSSLQYYVNPELTAGSPHFSQSISERKTFNLSLNIKESVPVNSLVDTYPNPSEWSSFIVPNPPSGSPPPKAFTRERIRQLFPVPLHIYYKKYVEREWKLHCIQKSMKTKS